MRYGKREATMTKGLAILCMLLLHLFCRTGDVVLGTPLIWINEEKPFVYLFGFFAEICVPIYSICAGYAQQLSNENEKLSLRLNLKRIKKLMINYWIVLVLFSSIGLIFDARGNMPGSITDFLKAVVLLHNYNGAWWYLNSYIILVLISPYILKKGLNKLGSKQGIVLCFCMQVIWYLVSRFELWPDVLEGNAVTAFVLKEVLNLFRILPDFGIGVFLCREKLLDRAAQIVDERFDKKRVQILLLVIWGVLFVATNLVHKAVTMGGVGLITFIIFNLLEKPVWVEKTFLFLGKHSTNIWLTHMFFYAYIFEGLVEVVRYPLFMLLFIILLCVVTSYIIKGIEKCIYKII